MIRKTLFLMMLMLPLYLNTACTNSESKNTKVIATQTHTVSDVIEDPVLTSLKVQCYLCHNPESPSHDAIIAPPMVAIKMRYKMMYSGEEAFVTAMLSYLGDPQKEKAIMPGAVQRFGLMLPTAVNKNDLEKIVRYIYNNELQEPSWFAEHYKSQWGKGPVKQ